MVKRKRRQRRDELITVSAKVPRWVVYRLRRAYPNISALIRRLLEREASKLQPNGGVAEDWPLMAERVAGPPGFEPGTCGSEGHRSIHAELRALGGGLFKPNELFAGCASLIPLPL